MKKLLLLSSLFLIVGCSAKPYAIAPTHEYTGTGSDNIFIVSHGWHTGIVIQTDEILDKLPQLKTRFGTTPYLEFGWGDKGFYQAKEITSKLTLKAIFWPTDSVMHVVSVSRNPRDYFHNSVVVTLPTSDKERSQLIDFIGQSFRKDISGNIVELKKGIYGNSQFYRGIGDYYLMNTCNKWTAKGLKSLGLEISPTFKLTSGSIMNYLQGDLNTVNTPIKRYDY